MTDKHIGDAQHNFRDRICDAWPGESFLEIGGKLRHWADYTDDGDARIVASLLEALIDSVDALAAHIDRLSA